MKKKTKHQKANNHSFVYESYTAELHSFIPGMSYTAIQLNYVYTAILYQYNTASIRLDLPELYSWGINNKYSGGHSTVCSSASAAISRTALTAKHAMMCRPVARIGAEGMYQQMLVLAAIAALSGCPCHHCPTTTTHRLLECVSA